MIAVGPHAPGLNSAPHFVRQVAVTAPDACTQAIFGIVRQFQGFLHGFKRRHGEYRAEDFFLENAHVVFTEQNGWLEVITGFQIPFQRFATSAGEHISALLFTDINVVQNGFHLPLRYLRAHLCVHIQRVAAADRFHAADGAFHKAFIYRFLHQCAARAGANFALVESKQRKTFQRFVEEGVLFVHHISKEDVWGFAAQFQRDWNNVLRRVLHDLLANFGRAGKRDFGDAFRRRQIFTDFTPSAVHHVDDSRRQ
ncbi:hypothetical protein D3C75_625300 [compost metagenome]